MRARALGVRDGPAWGWVVVDRAGLAGWMAEPARVCPCRVVPGRVADGKDTPAALVGVLASMVLGATG
jgi:hypothetical protein